MRRPQLLNEIRHINELLAADLELRTKAASDPRKPRLEKQVTICEEAMIKVERRLLELRDESQESVFADESAILESKLSELRTHARDLEEELRRVELETRHPVRTAPPGQSARLRSLLHELVTQMHSDPSVPRATIRPYQTRLADLVRARRAELANVVTDLERSARYFVEALTQLAAVATATENLAEAPMMDALPLRRERETVAIRAELGARAFVDAQLQLRNLAYDWPELRELSQLPDWGKVPVHEVRLEIIPELRTLGRIEKSRTALERVVLATRTLLEGLVLWIRELADRVRAVGPPA